MAEAASLRISELKQPSCLGNRLSRGETAGRPVCRSERRSATAQHCVGDVNIAKERERERKRKRLKDKSAAAARRGEWGAPPQSLLSSLQRGGGPCCCSYVYKLVSDTLTVRKTPSEGDARRRREGEGEEGEGGEKSVGAFSERDGRRERLFDRAEGRGERERETSQQSARWRGSKKGKGRLPPPRRCHGSRSEKERRERERGIRICLLR